MDGPGPIIANDQALISFSSRIRERRRSAHMLGPVTIQWGVVSRIVIRGGIVVGCVTIRRGIVRHVVNGGQ
jgi:hypothetical protein